MSKKVVLGLCVALNATVPAHAEDCDVFPSTNEAKLAADQCRHRENDKRLGKYFCYIKSMVGIQYPLKGQDPDLTAEPSVGKIRPSNERFFLTITKNDKPIVCSGPDKTNFLCLKDDNDYSFKADSYSVLRGGHSSDTTFFHEIFGYFFLFHNLEFTSSYNMGSAYLSKGKCEKIN